MVCLGLDPGEAGWQAQTNPLSYGDILLQFAAHHSHEERGTGHHDESDGCGHQERNGSSKVSLKIDPFLASFCLLRQLTTNKMSPFLASFCLLRQLTTNKMCPFLGSFCLFNTADNKYYLPMTGFEMQTSSVRSDRSSS